MSADSTDRPFRKLLVANRSEIAVRIFRAATELGLRTVGIYAQEDRLGVHRLKADEAYLVGQGLGPVAAYLDIAGIVALAVHKGVDLIHPGYGFLAENAAFARACAEAGITFVGPSASLLETMGDKTAARQLARRVGVPILPGTDDPITSREEALRSARAIGFPLIIKAAFGGGGRGMRVVHKAMELASLLDEARGEAERAFGNPAVFIEKYVPRAKHIEVQVLGDQHGNVVHLHERDCSVQRRHQKIVEIAPSVGLDDAIREALCQAAVRVGRAVGYDNAGTVEFLYDLDSDEWFFIEMNPRIQVEHTVTEMITGIDLVRAQILVAQGHSLFSPEVGVPRQEDIPRQGFAIQSRITTEDPANRFTPDYGKILTYRSAGGFGVRLDGGMGYAGAVITPYYDSLLVKLTATGQTFDIALGRMERALREFRIRGVKTNIPFLDEPGPERHLPHRTCHHDAGRHYPVAVRPSHRRRDRATQAAQLHRRRGREWQSPHEGVRVAGTPVPQIAPPPFDRKRAPPPGTRNLLLAARSEGLCGLDAQAEAAAVTDTTMRDAHQSLLATRVRSYDMLGGRRRPGPAASTSSIRWKCGAGRRSIPPCVSCARIPGRGCANCASASQHLLPDAVPGQQRGRLFQLSGQRGRRFRAPRGRRRHGYLPHLRFAELPAEPDGAHGSGARHACRVRGGALLHR